ncbi:glycosyltransferase family A protein [Pleurocapsa sp. PCC 7319]|uniref:glycosyltransferase family 2 protein n=1 Tax=Pleurocapsa sp. PCC 7319 TaxID=118161 RepID=UPI00034AC42E|nr:glycosyltransferase family A protein [Pleurocapsa sp. PCC 7319]
MTPLVSVCVPTFNAAKYLRECLDSILAQIFTDFELLIVDNHSSDETLSIVKEYAELDSRIRVIINQHNIGAVPNFNRCLELAEGEWIKYVHADDFIAPDCLEQMLAASQPESAIICCRRNFLFEPDTNEQTKKFFLKFLSDLSIDSLFPNSTEVSASDFCNVIVNYFWFNIVGEPTAVMLHRNAFDRFGTFNTNIIGICDIELWARIAIHTGLTYIPLTLATSRIHDRSLTNTNKINRHFRKKLDQLVLLHDFAFHPLYTPLRAAASDRQPALNFEDLLAVQGCKARKLAAQSQSNFSVTQEWEKIVQQYPILSVLSTPNPLRYTRRLLRKAPSLLSLLVQSIESYQREAPSFYF